MLKDECETSLMIESYNDTCIEHFNKNKKIVVANSEDKFKQQCSHNMPPTAYLFDQLKSKFLMKCWMTKILAVKHLKN